MELEPTERYIRDYERLPEQLCMQIAKKLELLVANMRHRSLRVKRIQGTTDLYEASVNMKYRVIFRLVPGAYRLLRIGTHEVFNEL